MSRQIYFFHSESDAIRFVQEIDKNKGMILLGDAVVPPRSIEYMIPHNMCTHSCCFEVIPANLVAIFEANKAIHGSAIIKFSNCTKGNNLSRTYESGRLYLIPTCAGNYVPETVELYEALRKFIKENYHFERKTGFYFALDFWEKYNTHYYYATNAGVPVFA